VSGNDYILNEAHYVASNIPPFQMLNLFAASVNISPLSGAAIFFWTERGEGRRYKIIKYHFTPKFPSSASTKNVQWE